MKKRVGFIIGNQLKEIRILHPDRITGGGIGLMRFGWVADIVNSTPEYNLHYEMYRPWRRYDALIFMKAFDPACQRLMARQQRAGRKAVFDANVNFYEEFGEYQFEGMRTGDTLRKQAEHMTIHADAVIADSPYLETVCRRYHDRVQWIPDNVDMRKVPEFHPTKPGCPLRLLWSGQAHKLFEFLAIEDTLRNYKDHIELVLVTNSLHHIERCHPPIRERLYGLLRDIPHQIIPFTSIPDLWSIYQQGGVCIAPRFLDNAYNQGHTEWKITLAMACGRVALCSPLSSYQAVQNASGGNGIRLRDTQEDWDGVFDEILSKSFAWECEESGARHVVEQNYDTRIIAGLHANWISSLWR